MNPCDELAPLLAEHASGELAPADRERLEAHLAGCATCRAEHASLSEVLDLAAIPAPSELEQHALNNLPGQVRAAWQAQERTRRNVVRYAAGAVMALAASMLVLIHSGKVGLPLSTPTGDTTELTLEAMADGPLEMAADDADTYSDDPEVPTTYSDEGDEE